MGVQGILTAGTVSKCKGRIAPIAAAGTLPSLLVGTPSRGGNTLWQLSLGHRGVDLSSGLERWARGLGGANPLRPKWARARTHFPEPTFQVGSRGFAAVGSRNRWVRSGFAESGFAKKWVREVRSRFWPSGSAVGSAPVALWEQPGGDTAWG